MKQNTGKNAKKLRDAVVASGERDILNAIYDKHSENGSCKIFAEKQDKAWSLLFAAEEYEGQNSGEDDTNGHYGYGNELLRGGHNSVLLYLMYKAMSMQNMVGMMNRLAPKTLRQSRAARIPNQELLWVSRLRV